MRVNLSRLSHLEKVELSKYIYGTSNLENIDFPDFIGGDCWLDGIMNASSIQLSFWIGGEVFLGNLIRAENLGLSNSTRGTLYLANLECVDGLMIPKDFQYVFLEALYLTVSIRESWDFYPLNFIFIEFSFLYWVSNHKNYISAIEV